MKHFTHKSVMKTIVACTLAAVFLMGLSLKSWAGLPPPDAYLTPVQATNIRCVVLATASGQPKDIVTIFQKRVGMEKHTFQAAYTVGKVLGQLEAYGYANASKIGSVKEAYVHAAVNLYSLYGCKPFESI